MWKGAVFAALCLALGAALSGCVTTQKKQEVRVHDGTALTEISRGQYDRAIEEWRTAIRLRSDDGSGSGDGEDSGYLADQDYLDVARYRTNIAFARLLQDRPREAKREYAAALRKLRQDVEAHKVWAEARNESLNSAKAFLGMLTGMAVAGAGGYMSGQATNYAQASQLQESTLALSTSIMELGLTEVDWTGFYDIKDQVPRDLEVGYIRMPFFAHYTGFAGIGKLVEPLGGHCTAFLVAPRLALTNAHCLHNEQGRLWRAYALRIEFDKLGEVRKVEPQAGEGRYMGGGSFGIKEFVVSPDWVWRPRGVEVEDCGRDWAILVLDYAPEGIEHLEILDELRFHSRQDRPIPRYRTVMQRLMSGDGIAVGGYSGDLNDGALISLDYGCRLRLSTPFLAYNCATFGGASGSPVISLKPGSPSLGKVIGINACGPKRREDDWTNWKSRVDLKKDALGTPVTVLWPTLSRLMAKYGSGASIQ